MKKTKKIYESFKNEYQESNFIIDEFTANIHKQYQEGEMEDTKTSTLMVKRKQNNPQPIGEISQIISKIDHLFRCVRIFSDETDKEKLKKMEEFGITELNKL